MQWSAEYSVNNHAIDLQHQRLLRMINMISDGMMSGDARRVSEMMLSELVAYTRSHFPTEERLLKKHEYPDFAAHKQEHERFVERVLHFQREVKLGRPASSLNLSLVLSEWFTQHVLGSDHRCAEYQRK